MKITAIALIVSLFALAAAPAGAQEAIAWRKVAETIPLGARVKVTTLDGKRVTGTLMRADDTSIMIKRDTRRPEPAMTMPYDSVANLERDAKNGGLHLGKALAIGAATGAGIILTMFAIALQLD